MIPVAKTHKMFIGGAFVRSESGRTFSEAGRTLGQTASIQLGRASSKDLRNAVEAAEKGLGAWQKCSPFLRSQILYRWAEMLEGKREEFSHLIEHMSLEEWERGLSSVIYFAGFCDKFSQVVGCCNPVAGPFHNVTVPESVGVVAYVGREGEGGRFGEILCDLAAILASGSVVVALVPGMGGALVNTLGESLVTSDLPAGAVNLLTGCVEEITPTMASHRGIQALSLPPTRESGHPSTQHSMQHSVQHSVQHSMPASLIVEAKKSAVGNMKRVVGHHRGERSIEHLMEYSEFKTMWHPSAL